MTTEAMPVTELTVTADGRQVAVWRLGPDRPVDPRRVVLVAPGFGRRMRHMGPVALYLAENGFAVYRCDYLDHPGRSDGRIEDFTFTGMYASLAATHEHILATEPAGQVAVVAASLSMRPAVRLAAQSPGVAGIVGIFGVVNPRYTLERVFGVDHAARELASIGPQEFDVFEGKRINSLSFSTDWFAHDWLDAGGTRRDLARVSCPVVNLCGSADDWVSLAEVKDVFATPGGPRRVVELPFVEHEVSKNPVAGQTVLREVARHALSFAGTPDADVLEPTFTDLATQIPYERALEATATPQPALHRAQNGSR